MEKAVPAEVRMQVRHQARDSSLLAEFVPDFLLGASSDLAPEPLPVRPEAERDGTDIPVLGRIEVDSVFAVPATARCRPLHDIPS
jgi:hypothetical protein